MTQRCKKCQKKYEDGSDGFCRHCLNGEQKKILGRWNNLGSEKPKGKTV